MKKIGNAGTIWRFLRGSFGFFLAALAFSVLNTLFTALTPQVIRVAVDSVIGDEVPELPAVLAGWLSARSFGAALLLCAGAIVASSLLAALWGFLSRTATARCSEGFLQSVRNALYEHIQRLPYAWHASHQTGEIIQRCTSDVEVIRGFVTNQCLEAVRIVLLVVVYFALMFTMNVKISLVALVCMPLLIGYSGFFYAKMGQRFLAADEAEGELTSDVQENLTGVRVVRAFGREAFEVDRFDRKNRRFSDLWVRLGKLMSVYWATGDFLGGLQILLVLLVGVHETIDGAITVGTLMAFLSYNAAMMWPVRSLGHILADMSKAGVSIRRVGEILEAEEEKAPANPVRPPMDRDVVFDHVTFAYPGGGGEVLRDVSFTIPAGKTFAILGATGSGKSTLAALLDRLYDLPEGCGKIMIGGVDLRDIPQSYLRQNVGLVLQEPFLFSKSVEENIKAARPETDHAAVAAAAKTACVDKAMDEMALGYDTLVGERGVTLSGGQKQRVAIARALLRETPILLLDDSLSAVDTQTDAQIRSALLETTRATLILISHRVSTLMRSDHILVLEDGRVAEEGTHAELLEKDGPYRRTYELQMSGTDGEEDQ